MPVWLSQAGTVPGPWAKLSISTADQLISSVGSLQRHLATLGWAVATSHRCRPPPTTTDAVDMSSEQ